jgi:hypothetical protein
VKTDLMRSTIEQSIEQDFHQIVLLILSHNQLFPLIKTQFHLEKTKSVFTLSPIIKH